MTTDLIPLAIILYWLAMRLLVDDDETGEETQL